MCDYRSRRRLQNGTFRHSKKNPRKNHKRIKRQALQCLSVCLKKAQTISSEFGLKFDLFHRDGLVKESGLFLELSFVEMIDATSYSFVDLLLLFLAAIVARI